MMFHLKFRSCLPIKRILTSFALLLATVSVVDAEPASDDRQASSRLLVGQYAGELKSALLAAMEQGGPAKAIEVCRDEAPRIASRLSRQSGARISRVSRQHRNPAGMPEPWQREVLEQFSQQLQQQSSAQNGLEFFQADGRTERYMKAIRIAPLCLSCHGADLAPEIRAQLQQDYPYDQASGYQLGDLRGAFSVVWEPRP